MTTRPHRILFATDFSGRCDRALGRSLRLARRWRSRLILFHVLEPPHDELTQEEREAEERRITAQLRSEAADAGIEVETRIATGSVPAAIAEAAEEVGAELIVTGVAHHDELGDFVLGTTVDRLVRHSKVPVLVVKQRPLADYRSILVATDFSDCSATALEVAAANFPEAALSLAHAYHVPLEPLLGREAQAPALQARIAEQLAEFLEQLHLPAGVRERIDFQVDYGETRQAIAGLVRSAEADLAVLGTHGRSALVEAVIGSNARALLESLPCDVMLVPDWAPLP